MCVAGLTSLTFLWLRCVRFSASCRSKKAAKRQAASKMLERIRNASCVVDNAVAEDDDCPEEELPLVNFLYQHSLIMSNTMY